MPVLNNNIITFVNMVTLSLYIDYYFDSDMVISHSSGILNRTEYY